MPSLESAPDLLSWGISQLKGLGMIFIIIVALVIILDFLKYIGVEKLIEKALKPFLNFLGVGEKASTIAVVGVTLGIGFGAGLLIKEVKTGKLHYKDGSVYEGEFTNANPGPNGKGKLTKKNGEVIKGLWKHGEFLK